MPIMMESVGEDGKQWQASSWLGVITAGSLWTPMHKDDLNESIDAIIQQIEVGLSEVADSGTLSTEDNELFSKTEVRDELDRLRDTPAFNATGGQDVASNNMADVPSTVSSWMQIGNPTFCLQEDSFADIIPCLAAGPSIIPRNIRHTPNARALSTPA